MNNHPDIPPISVVTTSSTGGGSGRRAPKMKTGPTILMKPPASRVNRERDRDATSSTTMRVSHVGDSGGDAGGSGVDPSIPQGSMAMTTTLPLSSSSSTTPPHPTNETNDAKVDSALLSALRDKRERMALLRLEQTLIDFMNDRNCGYMEVGGHLNSIVIRGASGGGSGSSSSADLSNINSHSNNNSNGGEGKGESDVNANSNTSAVNNGTRPTNGLNQNTNGYMNMTSPTAENNGPGTGVSSGTSSGGMRQTSFQRLCLHRLADRFNIVREQGYNVMNNNNTYNYHNTHSNNPGLIRLVKVKESRIPNVKLIDLDLSQYESGAPQDRNQTGYGVSGIADRLASTSLQNDGGTGGGVSSGGNMGSSGKKPKKKEKVKIMKRLSSGKNQENEKEKSSNSKNRRKGKKLSEKEKAYAEARARIFNDTGDATSTSPTKVDNSEHSLSPANENADAVLDSSVHNSAIGSVHTPQSHSPLSGQDVSQQIGSTTADAPIKAELKGKRNNIPAAATGGGTSKVTWRNREQEASDPDFRRRHHPVIMQPVPVAVQGQYVHHQYNGTNGVVMNSHNHQGGGYHYPGIVDGQQQHLYNHGGHVPIYHPQTTGGHYHADPSWLVGATSTRPEVSPNSYTGTHSRHWNNQSIHGSNHSHEIATAKTEPSEIASNREKIDLSQDEFPSLG